MATNTDWPVAVVVPSLGVRAMVVGGDIRVSVGDDGGKGKPWKFVFLPVWPSTDGSRLVLVEADGALIPAPDLETFDRLKVAQGRGNDIGPKRSQELWFTFNIPIDRWPTSGYGVLVFLYYFKIKGLGGDNFALSAGPGTEAAVNSEQWKRAFEAVKLRLLTDTIERLEPGVVRPQTPAANSRVINPSSPNIVSFAVASCAYPGDLLDRSAHPQKNPTPGPADASLLRLASRLSSTAKTPRPSFLLLAGDQIYADATAGLFDPAVLDDTNRNSYQGFFGSRGARAVFNKLPVYMMLDDHEIFDNWQPVDSDDSPENQGRLAKGRDQYWKFQRNAGPAPTYLNAPKVLWAKIEPAGVPVFMADTRSEREWRDAAMFKDSSRHDVGGFQGSRIFGDSQFHALKSWLLAGRDKPRPSFVLSASMLLPRPLGLTEEPASALHCDSWAGYPKSLHSLLAFLCDKQINNAVFLSGDAHLSSYTSICVGCEQTGQAVTLRSIHSSALYAPYPFANAVAEDFACDERFNFTYPEVTGNTYGCCVNTEFPPDGDGFAVITVETKMPPTWAVSICFDKLDDATKNVVFNFGSS